MWCEITVFNNAANRPDTSPRGPDLGADGGFAPVKSRPGLPAHTGAQRFS